MNRKFIFATLLMVVVLNAIQASAQSTVFTHQGNLGFSVVSAGYEFQFKLFETPTVGTGTQQGQTYSLSNVQVTNGAFTVQIDFGATVFAGGELYLETWWRDGAVGGAYTVLSSREKTTAVYSNRSLSAATADNATQLGGLPPSGFIQSTATQQPGNFNIAGSGTAGGTLSGNAVNAATQFLLGGNSVLSVSGPYNDSLSLGVRAGLVNTGGTNTFLGQIAGRFNTSGYGNTFVGSFSGEQNTTGSNNTFAGANAGTASIGSHNSFFGSGTGPGNKGRENSFFGFVAGQFNEAGNRNSFFGAGAGFFNESGFENVFVGVGAGYSNVAGVQNAIFGSWSGYWTTGSGNTFLGPVAGYMNKEGYWNVFVGLEAGAANLTGNSNTVIGTNANLAANNFENASAIGALAMVGQSNSMVLGSISGVNNAIADTKVGIGTTTPNSRLHVRANSGNVLIGDPGCNPGYGAIGFGSSMSGCTNYSLLGEGSNTYINRPVGGQIMFREGNVTQMTINSGGAVSINALGGGGTTQLCRNAINHISTCSSSLRYKTNVAAFGGGLNLVSRLLPITFNWKANGVSDLGLAAEDVAKVEPLLVTHNDKGEIEGVKYDRVAVVLLNAVKEQQEQIETLKRIVCLDHANHPMCRKPATGR